MIVHSPLFGVSNERNQSLDHEITLINCLLSRVDAEERLILLEFYVSLKSKPMLILLSSTQQSQNEFLHSLFHMLVGEDYSQHQVVVSHPWWLASSSDNYKLAPMQMRFVTEKILATIEEASSPENCNKTYFLCLTQLSPAELESCFSDVAFQLAHGELIRVGDTHLSAPIVFPENIWLIGTIDKKMVNLNNVLVDQAITMDKFITGINRYPLISKSDRALFQKVMLTSLIRDKQRAYSKLHATLSREKFTISPIFNVLKSIKQHGLNLPLSALDNCVIYLANAWSNSGQGIFDPAPSKNLKLAIDLAMKHFILARIKDQKKLPQGLSSELAGLLDTYPICREYISQKTNKI